MKSKTYITFADDQRVYARYGSVPGQYVAADCEAETLIGGRQKGRGPGRGTNKMIVFRMLERGGDVISRVVPDTLHKSLLPKLNARLIRAARSAQTTHSCERQTAARVPTGAVNHWKDEWVRARHHTKSLAGFWSHCREF